MKLTSVQQFQKDILAWYAVNKRDLPWRQLPFDTPVKQRDPYKILVSEIMLQQTQVTRVIPKYEAWIVRFPKVQDLASAETSEVLRLWSGLGYNRRALSLQRTAQIIVHEYRGIWPRDVEGLKQLPGVGEYTASAIACFAFNEQIAVVDTNVRKVILTKILRRENQAEMATEKTLQAIAEQLVPKGKAYEWNQALMDYASAMLKHERIPIPKQTSFIGSDRYYRGQIVKLLLEYKAVSIKNVGEILHKDKAFIERIVEGLEKDGLVQYDNDQVSLA